VALILRNGKSSPEVLFIIRAQHDDDPWSGNIGFPGGRLNDNGESPREAAERESFEELCLELNKAKLLGRLDDLYGATLPVLVSCFVYHLEGKPLLKPNHEIASTFWCPLPKLLEDSRHTHESFTYRGEVRSHPVVKLLEPDQPLLWGITYRLLRNFFAICDTAFGASEPL
jgi:8-oxo-dGTP pyrophosphatase MutT (NUDIX family)